MRTPLEKWLVGATYGLSTESAAQVRAEIEEHYESAIASGATEREALAALGDAKAANHQYRKVLLTGSDAKWLALVKRRGEGPTALWYVMIAFGLIGGTAQVLRGRPEEASVVLSNAIMAAVFLFPRWVKIDTRLRSYGYRTLRLAVMLSFPVALATRWHWNLMFAGCAGFGWAAFLVWATYKDHLLRRKLPTKDWPKELYL